MYTLLGKKIISSELKSFCSSNNTLQISVDGHSECLFFASVFHGKSAALGCCRGLGSYHFVILLVVTQDSRSLQTLLNQGERAWRMACLCFYEADLETHISLILAFPSLEHSSKATSNCKGGCETYLSSVSRSR